MTEPLDHGPASAGNKPLPNAPNATQEQRARARAWAKQVLSHHPDPDENEALCVRLGLRSRRPAA
ncbi:hypothetical protein J2S43_003040 [Catenuloplanes nepalensis]|uniref:Uncharacterized protein n=1 Tax=Catenuloplanes nepalensis TaxID=587533 RepID=A0ABT9MSX3_9ACTN|nr:hypothetical protein [Catenuloplanes nepalensis]MDP9794528.1 hypothetical protein [Catenuloplanes nepalensis]